MILIYEKSRESESKIKRKIDSVTGYHGYISTPKPYAKRNQCINVYKETIIGDTKHVDFIFSLYPEDRVKITKKTVEKLDS